MYDYRKAMKSDIQDYISGENLRINEANREEIEERLNEELWTADSVTGNASGSYTFNRYQAKEYVSDNMELLQSAVFDLGGDAETIGRQFLNGEWEYFDVTIRCYLLGECLSEVLDELQKIDEAFQGCGEAEKVIRQKLVDTHKDNWDNDPEWVETFSTGTTEEMIGKLYDSYCDDVFWMEAQVTLSELRDYLWEVTEDSEEVYNKLGCITDSYITCKAFDLMK